MKNSTLQIFVAVGLVALLFLLSDPFMLWMPPIIAMAALLLLAVLVSIWAGFIMHERGGDERDVVHRMQAGRAAYLSGVLILTTALIVQGFSHAIDPWISTALGAMVVMKLATRIYAGKHR
ncbi:MAG: hypothetical protein HY471_02360 [Candidatus Sungbacteria bacterium]|nr:hypothetical protein [Candidatus Sungbacteria bacterium]